MTIKKLNVPGPEAQAVLACDTASISPSYPRDYPFVMDHGRGSEVRDVDGNRYIDWAAGIASGVPLGAMIARQSIMTWPRGTHGSTYAGNLLACAAALATIRLPRMA